MTLRVVLDTNTVISGMLWKNKGAPIRTIRADENHQIQFYSSPFLLWEYASVLERAKFDATVKSSGSTRAELISEYTNKVLEVEPDFVPSVIPGDPPDNYVLACAVKAMADVIVSGNKHFLRNPIFGASDDPAAFVSYMGIPIVNAAGFVEKYLGSGPDAAPLRGETTP